MQTIAAPPTRGSPVASRAGGGIRRLVVALAAVAFAAAGCAGTQPASSGPAATTLGTGSAPGASASQLIGAWTTTITKADFTAAGLTDPGLQNENSGQFLWTFEPDGTWTQVQLSLDGSPINSPVFRGTYTADGGSLVVITEFPEQYRDSGLHYTWAAEGDGVRFDLLDPPDAVLPVVVETHPWTRSGG